jgi:5'-phosphate synthase pdxT subunit
MNLNICSIETTGVLALQGGFALHGGRPIRSAADLVGCDRLVLPGGESTVMLRLLDRDPDLRAALETHARGGKPVLATCAGLILAAARVENPEQASLGWLDITVRRNAWGRQQDSFTAIADDGITPLVFIRAPRIVRVGPRARVLLTYQGEPVMVQEGAIVGATFHPELA